MSVGAALRAAREERGLSVEDVSSATRIRAGLIRSIESDDFAGTGGAVYARGHIRSIARSVGLDPAPLIAQFDGEHADEVPAAVVPAASLAPEDAARVDRKSPNWAGAMAVVLVIVSVVAGVSLIGGGGGSPRTTAQDEPTVTQPTTPPPASPSEPASPPPSAVAQVPTGQAVALVRVTSSRTWMSVTSLSGRLLFQGLLSAGERKVFRDNKGLRLTIGNAPVGRPGAPTARTSVSPGRRATSPT